MESISEIQKWVVKHQKNEEDELPDKSKYRVTRTMAEGLKNNKPLPKGRCNFCGLETEVLYPIQMKVCLTCCNKFMKRGGQLEVIKKEMMDYWCDYCMTRTFSPLYINPRICIKCSNRIGVRHKFDGKDAKKEHARLKQYKRKEGI